LISYDFVSKKFAVFQSSDHVKNCENNDPQNGLLLSELSSLYERGIRKPQFLQTILQEKYHYSSEFLLKFIKNFKRRNSRNSIEISTNKSKMVSYLQKFKENSEFFIHHDGLETPQNALKILFVKKRFNF
jgi:hypothetical protein